MKAKRRFTKWWGDIQVCNQRLTFPEKQEGYLSSGGSPVEGRNKNKT